jgi:hypothetical protein
MPGTAIYPGSRILDRWTEHDWMQGLQIESVEDFTEIHVATRNSVYEITTIDGLAREIVVRGGRFFPVKTPARLAGSSLGGSLLKLGGIYVGFSLEIVTEEDTIITTHIRSVRVHPPAGTLHPSAWKDPLP